MGHQYIYINIKLIYPLVMAYSPEQGKTQKNKNIWQPWRCYQKYLPAQKPLAIVVNEVFCFAPTVAHFSPFCRHFVMLQPPVGKYNTMARGICSLDATFVAIFVVVLFVCFYFVISWVFFADAKYEKKSRKKCWKFLLFIIDLSVTSRYVCVVCVFVCMWVRVPAINVQ